MTSELQTQPSGEVTLLEVIAQAARDPNVDVSKMERLLEMRRQLIKDEAAVQFKEAMARVQSRVPRIDKLGKIVVPGKDGKSGHKTPYALYEDIDSGIRPIIQEEGFSESFTADSTPQGVIWRCIVSHRAGHQETYSTPPLPADQTGSKNAVQAVFSANSYAKRYLRNNIWNIITVGVDDDARATGYLNDEQIMALSDLLNDIGAKPGSDRLAKFLAYAEADSVSHIQQYRYAACMAMLRKAAAQKEGR